VPAPINTEFGVIAMLLKVTGVGDEPLPPPQPASSNAMKMRNFFMGFLLMRLKYQKIFASRVKILVPY
jgi:hypothetical protein